MTSGWEVRVHIVAMLEKFVYLSDSNRYQKYKSLFVGMLFPRCCCCCCNYCIVSESQIQTNATSICRWWSKQQKQQNKLFSSLLYIFDSIYRLLFAYTRLESYNTLRAPTSPARSSRPLCRADPLTIIIISTSIAKQSNIIASPTAATRSQQHELFVICELVELSKTHISIKFYILILFLLDAQKTE